MANRRISSQHKCNFQADYANLQTQGCAGEWVFLSKIRQPTFDRVCISDVLWGYHTVCTHARTLVVHDIVDERIEYEGAPVVQRLAVDDLRLGICSRIGGTVAILHVHLTQRQEADTQSISWHLG